MKQKDAVREMAQHLRVTIVQFLAPIWKLTIFHNSSSKGYHALLCLCKHHVLQTHTCKQNTHRLRIKENKF